MNKSTQFKADSYYDPYEDSYELLPFRHTRLPNVPDRVLLTSHVGEYLILSDTEFKALKSFDISRHSELFKTLRTRQFICDKERGPFLKGIASQQATRKLFAQEDPTLHIFIVTIRCDHRCHYCQVTPRLVNDSGYDMDALTATAALDRVFESRAPSLTIEFQGGEPALAFDTVRMIVESAEIRAAETHQNVHFVLTTTLHLLTEEMLNYCRSHKIQISTSLDGPRHVHNANRINPGKNSYDKTIDGIARARDICGHDSVDALATITRHSLPYAKEIVDCYLDLGFTSIAARPISPFGFAVKSEKRIGYSVGAYLKFYRELLDYLININLSGTNIEESYASLLLTRILTPFPTAYVDLQSPSAAGTNVLAYNYDGGVYVSDEGRMLAEMGDNRFRMGSVHDELTSLRSSKAMAIIKKSGTAEKLPVCSDCAFVPYCGADPVLNVATQNDPVGDRETSEFCQRHTGLFQILFEYLESGDPDVMRVFLSWISRHDISKIPQAGYMV